jgi:2'-5' RNA ligase
LKNLARATEQAVAAIGVPVEARGYAPHLTLARVRDSFNPEPLAFAAGSPDFGVFRASSFVLYLSMNGKYSKLAEFPFHP